MSTIYVAHNELAAIGSGTLAEADVLTSVYDDSAKLVKSMTGADLREFAGSGRVNATAATLTVTNATHAGRIVTLNRAAGIAVTLPVATGTGARFTFFVGTTITSNTTTIKVPDANGTMRGNAIVLQDGGDTMVGFEAGSTADTITLNGTTTGGLLGDIIELVDVGTDLWMVRCTLAATGTEATPFSATV